MAYRQGEQIRILSPLGMVLIIMLMIWVGSYLFHHGQLSAEGELTEAERKKRAVSGTVAVGAAVT